MSEYNDFKNSDVFKEFIEFLKGEKEYMRKEGFADLGCSGKYLSSIFSNKSVMKKSNKAEIKALLWSFQKFGLHTVYPTMFFFHVQPGGFFVI